MNPRNVPLGFSWWLNAITSLDHQHYGSIRNFLKCKASKQPKSAQNSHMSKCGSSWHNCCFVDWHCIFRIICYNGMPWFMISCNGFIFLIDFYTSTFRAWKESKTEPIKSKILICKWILQPNIAVWSHSPQGLRFKNHLFRSCPVFDLKYFPFLCMSEAVLVK